jgi:hypothetical protein
MGPASARHRTQQARTGRLACARVLRACCAAHAIHARRRRTRGRAGVRGTAVARRRGCVHSGSDACTTRARGLAVAQHAEHVSRGAGKGGRVGLCTRSLARRKGWAHVAADVAAAMPTPTAGRCSPAACAWCVRASARAALTCSAGGADHRDDAHRATNEEWQTELVFNAGNTRLSLTAARGCPARGRRQRRHRHRHRPKDHRVPPVEGSRSRAPPAAPRQPQTRC